MPFRNCAGLGVQEGVAALDRDAAEEGDELAAEFVHAQQRVGFVAGLESTHERTVRLR